jgi:hypothetical protein
MGQYFSVGFFSVLALALVFLPGSWFPLAKDERYLLGSKFLVVAEICHAR